MHAYTQRNAHTHTHKKLPTPILTEIQNLYLIKIYKMLTRSLPKDANVHLFWNLHPRFVLYTMLWLITAF